MRSPLLTIVVVAVTLSAVSLSAGAVSAQTARERFQRGQVAYNQGDYETAIREWQAAYAQDARPLLQYNLSQAYERLGQLAQARDALELYVGNAAANDTNQADARARLASIRERLARTGVRIAGGPDNAEIQIDGRAWGRTPRPDAISLEPGTHRIVVRLAGYADFNSTIVVPAGQTVEVPVEMTATGSTATNTTATNTTTTNVNPTTTNSAASSTDSGAGSDLLVPIVLFSVAGAAAIVGTILGVSASSQAGSAPTRDGPEASGARSLALVADISFVTALVAAGVGATMLVIELGRGPSRASTTGADLGADLRIAPYATPSGGGVVAFGRF